MKLTDEQTKYALEKCKISDCIGCPCHSCVENCLDVLTPNALDLINRKDKKIAELQFKNSELEIELKAMRGAANSYKSEFEMLKRFKDYFDSLYGIGLEVAEWHHNGMLEPFDNFYDSAIEEMVGG